MQCHGDKDLGGDEGAPWRAVPGKKFPLMCAMWKRSDVFPGEITGDKDHLLPKARRHGQRIALTLT